jgi:hypothetical protein
MSRAKLVVGLATYVAAERSSASLARFSRCFLMARSKSHLGIGCAKGFSQ